MAFNKNKVIALAQKFVQKGQIDRAIKEYQKVLDVDPKDIRTRLKVGDLYAKKGDTQEAAEIYQEVAESYSRDGFYLKAVAVYKNILKLAPSLIEVNLKLGDLYHQLSLLGDAMSQYQIVVNYYDRNGMVKESLDTLKKMVELDPENITFRVNLAELYHKEGHLEQSLGELEAIVQELKNTDNSEDLVKVYERIIHHDPSRLDIIKDLSQLYLKLHQPQRALSKLQISFKTDPKDSQTLELLAQSFLLLEQPKKAKSVFKELLQIYETSGNSDERDRVAQEILKIAPEDEEANQAVSPGGEVPSDLPVEAPDASSLNEVEPSPDEDMHSGTAVSNVTAEVTDYDEEVTEFSMHNIASPLETFEEGKDLAPSEAPLESPVSMDEPLSSENAPVVDLSSTDIEEEFEDLEEEIHKLMTETEVYLKYGLSDKAKEHLEAILQKDSKHIEARKKLKELFLSNGQQEEAITHLKKLIQIVTEKNDPDAISLFQQELSQLDSSAVSVEPTPATDSQSSENLEIPAAEPLETLDTVDPVEDGVMDLDMGEAVDLDQGEEIALNPQPVDSEGLDLSTGIEMTEEVESLDSIDFMPSETDEQAPVAEVAPDVSELSLDEEVSIEVEVSEDGADASVEMDISESVSVLVEDDMSSPEATDQGDEEIIPDLDVQAEGIEVSEQPAESTPVSEQTAEPVITMEPVTETSEEVLGIEISTDEEEEIPLEVREELDEAEFFIQQGLKDEAEKIFLDLSQRYPNHPQVQAEIKSKSSQIGGISEVENPIPETIAPEITTSKTKVTVSDPVEQTPTPVPGGDISEENFDLAAELAEELEGYEEEIDEVAEADEQIDFNEVFEEFKKGVAEQLSHEDSETHFDLGLAYKEMNLIDDAISEFQVAMDQNERVIEGHTMIGLCYMDKGEFEKAIEYFSKGLSFPNLGRQEIVGLNYELAVALQSAGKDDLALEIFQKVEQVDPDFREIEQKTKELLKTSSEETSHTADDNFDLGQSLANDLADLTPPENKMPSPSHDDEFPDMETPSEKSVGSQLTESSAFDTPSENKGVGKSVAPLPTSKKVNKPKKEKNVKSKQKISYI